MPDENLGQKEERPEHSQLEAGPERTQAACRIVFACTGNTCRSPLAQVLCIKLLAEQLGCAAEDLPGRGYVVESGGLAAWPGLPASPEAVEVGRAFGVDLSAHASRALTAADLADVHYLFVMTQNHMEALAACEIPGAPQPRLLSADGSDISDPVGADADVYQECAAQILRALEQLLPELLRTKEGPP